LSSHEQTALSSFLSGNDAIKLLEVIHSSLTCDSEADFSSLFPKLQELFSFDFVGTLLGRHDNGNGLVIAHGVNISFPDEWLSEYLENNYFHHDVITVETFRTCKPQHWSYEIPGSEDIVPKRIKMLNMDLGIREAYSHGSAPAAQGQNGSMFCFASPSMKNDVRTAVILEVVVPHLHLVFNSIFSETQFKSTSLGIALTTREKEVLNWLKQGKSSWDMSVILGIRERTINYHVYNIMEKLGAVNRPQAVAIATRLGLIDLG
jgi:LuxR family transcriptional regulator, quorum-sensing system regulator CviR